MEYDGRRIRFEQETKVEEKKMIAQSCLKFRWYVWKGGKKATVEFKSSEGACRAVEMFRNGGEFDGKVVRAELKDRKVLLDNLNEITDEIYLKNALEVFGEIVEIHL